MAQVTAVREESQTATTDIPLSPFEPGITLIERHCRAPLYATSTGIPLSVLLVDIQNMEQSPAPQKVVQQPIITPAPATAPRFCGIRLHKVSTTFAKICPGPLTPETYGHFHSHLVATLNQYPDGRALLADTSTHSTLGAFGILTYLSTLAPNVITQDVIDQRSVPDAIQLIRESFQEEMEEAHAIIHDKITHMTRRAPIEPWQLPTYSNLQGYLDHLLATWEPQSPFILRRKAREVENIIYTKDLIRSISMNIAELMDKKLKERADADTMTFGEFIRFLKTVVPKKTEEYHPFPL